MNIIELAKEAGLLEVKVRPAAEVQLSKDALERFADLVREQTLKDDKDLLTAYLVGFKAGHEEREWVDLTDDEIFSLGKEKRFPDTDPVYFARAVIAAFKEKNK